MPRVRDSLGTNVGQAATNIIHERLRRAFQRVGTTVITSFPELHALIANLDDDMLRDIGSGVEGALEVSEATVPNPYLRGLIQAAVGAVGGVTEGAADATNITPTKVNPSEVRAKLMRHFEKAAEGKVVIHENVAHRGDGNCVDFQAKKTQWSKDHPSTPRRVGSGTNTRTVNDPGEPFSEISVLLSDAVEQGATPCSKCMQRYIRQPEWAKPAEPPKPKDWWDAYESEEILLIAQLPELFGEEAADLLEYMKAAPAVLMKPVLAKYNNNGTLRPEVVPAIRDALYAWTGLDKTAKDRIGAMLKEWTKKKSPEGQAALQTAKAAAEKAVKVAVSGGLIVLILLCLSLTAYVGAWVTGYSAGLAIGATFSLLVSFFLLLAFVIPLDALADTVRGFIVRVTGWEAEKIDLDGVKNGLRTAAAQVVVYGIFLTLVIRWGGEDSSGGRLWLALSMLATQALALVIAANPILLGGEKDKLTLPILLGREKDKLTLGAFRLIKWIAVAGAVIALFGWVVKVLLGVGVVTAVIGFFAVNNITIAWWLGPVILGVFGAVALFASFFVQYPLNELGQRVATRGLAALKAALVIGGMLAVPAALIWLIVAGIDHHDAEKAALAERYRHDPGITQQVEAPVAPTPAVHRVVKVMAVTSSPESKDTGKKAKVPGTRRHSDRFCENLLDEGDKANCRAAVY